MHSCSESAHYLEDAKNSSTLHVNQWTDLVRVRIVESTLCEQSNWDHRRTRPLSYITYPMCTIFPTLDEDKETFLVAYTIGQKWNNQPTLYWRGCSKLRRGSEHSGREQKLQEFICKLMLWVLTWVILLVGEAVQKLKKKTKTRKTLPRLTNTPLEILIDSTPLEEINNLRSTDVHGRLKKNRKFWSYKLIL